MDKGVQEWISKAEEDYHSALALRRVRTFASHNSVCFHAQQCVEKLLKALLEKNKVVPRKIHALPILLDQCSVYYPLLSAFRPDMIRLSIYAVEFRYPGESATLEDAKASITIMKAARSELLSLLQGHSA
ncbi:MAG TPA: HEPN domain-containing protein [Kiritimatiellia bacterium]|nr:HEPN domain-containing protein [Kiritimatiellia bacterium]